MNVFRLDFRTQTSTPVFSCPGGHALWTCDGDQLVVALTTGDFTTDSITAFDAVKWEPLWTTPFPDHFPRLLSEVSPQEIAAIGGVDDESGWLDHRMVKLVSPHHAPYEFGLKTDFSWSIASAKVNSQTKVSVAYTSADSPVEIGKIEFQDGAPVYQMELETELKGPHHLIFTHDGSTLVALSSHSLSTLNAKSGKTIRSRSIDRIEDEITNSLQRQCLSRDGRLIGYTCGRPPISVPGVMRVGVVGFGRSPRGRWGAGAEKRAEAQPRHAS